MKNVVMISALWLAAFGFSKAFASVDACGSWGYNGWVDDEGNYTGPGCARPDGGTFLTYGTVENPLTGDFSCPSTCHYTDIHSPSDWAKLTPDANGNCIVTCSPN